MLGADAAGSAGRLGSDAPPLGTGLGLTEGAVMDGCAAIYDETHTAIRSRMAGRSL